MTDTTEQRSTTWQNAFTMLQEIEPPFVPEGFHAMTVVIDYAAAIRVRRRTGTPGRRSGTSSKARCCSSWRVRRRG